MADIILADEPKADTNWVALKSAVVHGNAKRSKRLPHFGRLRNRLESAGQTTGPEQIRKIAPRYATDNRLSSHYWRFCGVLARTFREEW